MYAGVDYAEILASAEKEADVILWDGGNNDWPFFRSDLEIVLVDPHRPGHELLYHPGETNQGGMVIVVTSPIGPVGGVQQVMENIAQANPTTTVIRAHSNITVDKPELVRGKRFLVVEDGPTLTHGGMRYGSGTIAAQRYGAAEIVDPRLLHWAAWSKSSLTIPGWQGTSGDGLFEFAIGGSRPHHQLTPCDSIVVATPVDLARLIAFSKPHCRVRYDLEEISHPDLGEIISSFLHNHR